MKYGANEAAELTDRNLPRYIRITDIDKNGSLIDEKFRSLPEEIAQPYLLSAGDVLLARSGATVGKAFVYSEEHGRAAYAGYLIRARVNERLVRPCYLYTFLQSSAYWAWISLMLIQATIQNVSAEKYANLSIPLPSVAEQDIIFEGIADRCALVDAAISRTQRQIELVREYRTRLIADVVTGKLDVRGVQEGRFLRCEKLARRKLRRQYGESFRYR